MPSRKPKPKPARKPRVGAVAPPRARAAEVPPAATPAPAEANADQQQAGAPLPDSADLWRLRMEFAMGGIGATANYLSGNGIPPLMVVQGLLRFAGMIMDAYNLGGAVSPSEEVALGRMRQQEFVQRARAAATPPTSLPN